MQCPGHSDRSPGALSVFPSGWSHTPLSPLLPAWESVVPWDPEGSAGSARAWMPAERWKGSSRGCWEARPPWPECSGRLVCLRPGSLLWRGHCGPAGWGGVRSGCVRVSCRRCPGTRTRCPLYQHVLPIIPGLRVFSVSVST